MQIITLSDMDYANIIATLEDHYLDWAAELMENNSKYVEEE